MGRGGRQTDRQTESGDEVEPDPRWPITSSPLAWKIFADSRLHHHHLFTLPVCSPPPLTMAKKALANDQIVKLIVGAGQASPSPPVGPALGSRGVKSMDFCKVRWNTTLRQLDSNLTRNSMRAPPTSRPACPSQRESLSARIARSPSTCARRRRPGSS